MKNKTMRVAALLLALTLMTSCFVGGTFAKYTTGEQGSDFARVAKWGVEVEVESFNLFAADYATEIDANKGIFTNNYTVSSATSDRDDVMAPGTSGTFANIAITGTPEVAVDVSVVATVTVSDNWIVDGDFYCPIVFTIGSTKISGLDCTDADDFEGKIKKAIDDFSKKYDPNTDLTSIDANFDISWAWAFEGSTDAEDLTYGQTDVKDTKLGNQAVAGDLSITVGVKITVEQVD